MPDDDVYYRWRVPNSRRPGRWRELRFEMTEARAADWAASEGVKIEKVENSGVKREARGGGNWASNIQRKECKR